MTINKHNNTGGLAGMTADWLLNLMAATLCLQFKECVLCERHCKGSEGYVDTDGVSSLLTSTGAALRAPRVPHTHDFRYSDSLSGGISSCQLGTRLMPSHCLALAPSQRQRAAGRN